MCTANAGGSGSQFWLGLALAAAELIGRAGNRGCCLNLVRNIQFRHLPVGKCAAPGQKVSGASSTV